MSGLSDQAAADAAAAKGGRGKVAERERVFAFDPVEGRWVRPGENVLLFRGWAPRCMKSHLVAVEGQEPYTCVYCGAEGEWLGVRRRLGVWVYRLRCTCIMGCNCDGELRITSPFRFLVGGPRSWWRSWEGREVIGRIRQHFPGAV